MEQYFQNTLIYTYGIATLVAIRVFNATEEQVMLKVNRVADAFLMQEDVLYDKIPKFDEGAEKLFDKTVKRNPIYEGVLLVEKENGGKSVDSPMVATSITKMLLCRYKL